jgi:hypothetical protein
VVQLARNLHPEFGYLCRSRRRRRRLRSAVAFVALALIAGAGSVAVRLAGHDERPLQAMALAPGEGIPSRSQARAYVQVAPPAAEPLSASGETTASACRDARSQHLDGKCGSPRMRKPRIVRVPVERPAIAAIPLGRTDRAAGPNDAIIPVAPAPHASDVSTASVAAKPPDAAAPVTTDPAPANAVPAPPVKEASVAKKLRRKTAHHQAVRRDAGVYASTSAYDYQSRRSVYAPGPRMVFW